MNHEPDEKPVKRSLVAQMSAVQQEIEMREKVYAGLVAKGKMRQGEADYKTDDMRAVADTLAFLMVNEDLIRNAVKLSKAGRTRWFDCPNYPECNAPDGTICKGCPGKTRSLAHLLEG